MPSFNLRGDTHHISQKPHVTMNCDGRHIQRTSIPLNYPRVDWKARRMSNSWNFEIIYGVSPTLFWAVQPA